MAEDAQELKERFLRDQPEERDESSCPFLQAQGASKKTPSQSSVTELPNGKQGTTCKYAQSHKKSIDTDDVRVPLEDDSEGCVLSFHNVGYHVVERSKVPGGCCCCKQSETKHILSDVSGICEPGMTAILGPTGSGKSSLLDILAARKDPRGLTGSVLVNGKPQPQNFKCMAGYVIQDDIVMGMLTVRENIQFSASLRLPSSMSIKERHERVEEVITDLGLEKCANTRVGTEFIRGVSGGERKRTNIAMELIISPKVLFLDEPTTGLDANTAYSVMHLLQRLSLRGKTIIFSVHQPRYSIFKLFDRMMLLSHGELVYQGEAKEALDHFQDLGFFCEEHNNPPDFFLDVLNGGLMPLTCPAKVPIETTSNGSHSPRDVRDKKGLLVIDIEEDADVMSVRQKVLVERYRQSKYHLSVKEKLEAITGENSKQEKETNVVQPIQYATSFARQFAVVSKRTWQNMIRNRHTMMSQLMSAIILGLLVGAIYYQVDKSYTSGIQNRLGAFFFIVMNYVFGNMSAVDIFIKDRAIFIHENISGFYRVSSYFFAKLAFDVVPQRALPIIVFALITYWMIGLQHSVFQFFFYLINIILTCMAGTSVALLFSATMSTHTVGTILTALVWVIMMVFSGLLVNIETIPYFLRWIKWFSIFRYSMNGFTVNELVGEKFCDLTPSGNYTILICDKGNDYMQRQGIPYSTSWDLWVNEVALAIIGICFLTMTYIQLRCMKKLK